MAEFIVETFTLTFYATYLLIGTVIGLLIEISIRSTGNEVTGRERFSLICGWPVMGVVFIYHFIKGFLNNDQH